MKKAEKRACSVSKPRSGRNQMMAACLVVTFCTIANVSAQETRLFVTPPHPQDLAESLFPELTRGLIRKQNTDPPTVAMKIEFEFASSEIEPGSDGFLEAIANMLNLQGLDESVILIEGHTDAVGDPEFNQRLSERRAEAVRRYLVDVFSIRASRLKVMGKGEQELLDPANPDAAANRRVQIRALSNS